MKNLKSLSMLLALLTVGTAVVSCGGDAEKESDTAADTTAAVTTEAVTEAPSPLELMPEADYGGHDFHCLLNNQDDRFVDIMTAGEENGDILNDLIFKRNRRIEEKYNIVITGEDVTFDQIHRIIRKQVQSGLTDYDLYFGNCYVAPAAQEGLLYKLNDLPNVDLSKPWWDPAALAGMSIGGDVYMATGDISPTCLLTTSCLAFNKNLFQNNDMEYPYQLAADGKWTIDKLAEMTKGLTSDLNGDGKYVLNEDLFGFSSWFCDSPYSLFYGAGGMMSKKNADDIPEIDWNMDHITEVYEVMYQIINDNNSYFVTDPAQYPTTYECFSNGGAYFCEVTLQKIDLFLRDMQDDYGILPMPKWNEEQEDYLSVVNGAGGFIVAPNNPEDENRTGMIMEALAATAYEDVTPSLYEVITKSKNVRDEESAEMVNLIIRNRVYDPYYISLIPGFGFAQDLLPAKSKEVASNLEKQRPAAEKAMQKMIDAYLSLE